MQFVVFGAGAIGGVIGGRLFQHGHDVVLVARGEHAAAIAERGLRLESPGDTVTLPVPVAHRIADAPIGDRTVVVLAMKGHDTHDALAALVEVAPPDTPVVCAQNGVDNERRALRYYSDVYGMCVMCPATHLQPGVVHANSAPVSGILDVGRYPGGVDERAEQLAAALRASTFESRAIPDVMRWKYTKLLMNLGNAVDAVCPPGPEAAELARRARREGAACLRAAGIGAASREEDAARRGDLLRIAPIAGAPRGGGSSWQSLQRASGAIEADHLNGEIVLLGRLHGVPTPVNELLRRVANRCARERRPPGSVSAEELLAVLDEEVPRRQ